MTARRGGGLRPGARELGDPEVEELDHVVVALAEEHVGGLQVAVNDAEIVGTAQAAADLFCDAYDFGGLELSDALQSATEVFAFEGLHHDERHARQFVDAVVVNAHHVRAPDPRRGLGLPLEASAKLLVLDHVDVHELHRDRGIEVDVGGAPHRAHAAARDFGGESVAAGDQRADLGAAHHPDSTLSRSFA